MAVGGRPNVLVVGEFYIDWRSDFSGERMTHEVEIATADPIAKKTIGRLDCCCAAVHCDKIERPDPGLETDLAQSLANPVNSLLPHTVHFFSPSLR